jgi:hypothetical protein
MMRRIYTSYGNGGVSHFFQAVYSLLSFMPAVHLRANRFQTNSNNFQLPTSLRNSVAGVTCETYYRKFLLATTFCAKSEISGWESCFY